MALLTDGTQNLGSYYCLIRRRFKRRRKKRSERKGAQAWRMGGTDGGTISENLPEPKPHDFQVSVAHNDV
ncbi:hypothetical protein D4764_01G0003410 [Takifugu flavidus]|uniref:Uncharacterized protein n=1 Tax=Takifugu flavidus TaxID=433684 RepID=A0A5C6PNP8_9TELE|nr:hypothetical protein D4764_01G0003410 [Takifugu flavidus]